MSEKKKKNSSASGMGALALLLLLGAGGAGYMGIGGGNGNGNGTADTAAVEKSEEKAEQSESVDSNTSIVKISEDTVTINGEEIADEAALSDYLQKVNTDQMVWVLEEDNAILETRNWVLDTFSAQSVELKK